MPADEGVVVAVGVAVSYGGASPAVAVWLCLSARGRDVRGVPSDEREFRSDQNTGSWHVGLWCWVVSDVDSLP